ncbi:cofactor FMO1 FAD enzyme [Xylariaceae sp. FL0804]|nr:cofactor FMO1 FAD enzyme [Xylariaceae sp. FL0804]
MDEATKNMAMERVDIVVVGAGWSGLISAKTYLDFEPNAKLIILDNHETIGGTWAKERLYPSLYAQSKIGLFEYSFYPMRNEGITKDGYISCATIHKYLNDFAEDYNLVERTRLLHTVTTIERLSEGGWRLNIANKPAIETAKLIWASGQSSDPVVPKYPQTNFHAPIIHSADTGRHLDAIEKCQSATVVGAAKSAFDTVFLLLNAGKKVDWIIRDDGSGPLAVMPPTIFGLFNSVDVISTRFSALFGASIMKTSGPGYQFFHRTRLGRAVAQGWWKAVHYISAYSCGYAKNANTEKLRPLPRSNGIFWANSGLGTPSVPNYWKVFHSGDCTVHRTNIASMEDDTIVLRNGQRIETDYVIMATGFVKSCRAFPDDLKALCGLAPDPTTADRWDGLMAAARARVDELLPVLADPPADVVGPFGRAAAQQDSEVAAPARDDPDPQALAYGPCRHYRRMVSPYLAARGDRSLYFAGLVHNIYTPMVGEVQALWGVAFLLGLHLDPASAPTLGAMEEEAALWNAWTAKRYRGIGNKHSYAIFDFQSYIDTLLGDLGVRTTRRSNPVAEMFLPMRPRDYRGIVDEFRQALNERHFREAGMLYKSNGATSSTTLLNGDAH